MAYNYKQGKGESHDNYKKCIKFNDILLDNQPQPTGSFNKNNIQFWYICNFANQSGLGTFPVALFLCLIGAVRLRSVTGRQKEILKQVQDDRSHTDYFDKLILDVY